MKTKVRSLRNGSKSTLPSQSANLQRPAARAGGHRKAQPVRDAGPTFIRILSVASASLGRDLKGQLFLLKQTDGMPCPNAERQIIDYAQALKFVAQYTNWSEPADFLALFGISAPAGKSSGASEPEAL